MPTGKEASISPASGSITITKSDTVVFPVFCRSLYVGVAGDVKVRMPDNTTPTFPAVPAGTTLGIQFDMVFSTGTSASGMVGLT